LRSFQIKLNLRTIVTNIALCGFGLKISNNCTFCHSSPETLMHLFCNCHCVEIFWKNMACYISRLLKICLMLNNFNKIFGFQKDNNCNIYLINCLLLCARYVNFIFKFNYYFGMVLKCFCLKFDYFKDLFNMRTL